MTNPDIEETNSYSMPQDNTALKKVKLRNIMGLLINFYCEIHSRNIAQIEDLLKKWYVHQRVAWISS